MVNWKYFKSIKKEVIADELSDFIVQNIEQVHTEEQEQIFLKTIEDTIKNYGVKSSSIILGKRKDN